MYGFDVKFSDGVRQLLWADSEQEILEAYGDYVVSVVCVGFVEKAGKLL